MNLVGRLARLVPMGIYILILLAFTIASVQHISAAVTNNELLSQYKGDHLEFADFLLYYMFGQIASGPDAPRLYDHATQLAYFNKLIFPASIDKPFYAVYSPFVAVMMIPLSHLPPYQAYFVWLVAILLLGAVSLFMLLRVFKLESRFALILIACLGSFPAMLSVRMGQTGWTLLALTSLFFWAFMKGRDWLSGLALALLAFKPHYALVFGVAALTARKWKLIAFAALFEALLYGAAVPVLGLDAIVGYPNAILHGDSVRDSHGFSADRMVSVRVIASLFLGDKEALQLSLAVMVLGLLLTAWIWSRRGDSRICLAWKIVATVFVCMVASPHTHSYDLLMLAVASVAFVGVGGLKEAARLSNTAKVLLCAYPILSWLFMLGLFLNVSLPFVLYFLLDLAIFVLAAVVLVKLEGSSATDQQSVAAASD